jgi:hypothetical protein
MLLATSWCFKVRIISGTKWLKLVVLMYLFSRVTCTKVQTLTPKALENTAILPRENYEWY